MSTAKSDLDERHRLHMASWKVTDGGVVVWAYQAFCKCHWAQRWPTRSEAAALEQYEAHKRSS